MSATDWKLDPAHSQVEFSVKHMMFTTVRGRFADVDGWWQSQADASTAVTSRGAAAAGGEGRVLIPDAGHQLGVVDRNRPKAAR